MTDALLQSVVKSLYQTGLACLYYLYIDVVYKEKPAEQEISAG